MKHLPVPIALPLVLLLAAGLPGQQRKEDKDNPDLPRVLVIGDSISIGYAPYVEELLGGKANVHRIPENGGPTTNGLAKLDKWLGKGKWDVIHFNWGLHDIKRDKKDRVQVPLDQYEENLRKLVNRLKRTKAKLIWVTTTPVPSGRLNPPRRNGDVIAYNAAARKIMRDNGVAIDDLYSLALPRLAQVQRPANVHFNDAGYELLGRKVADSIRAALAREKR